MSAPSLLEQRYRRVLRLLPEGYRAAWEEDMVTALLDARGVDGSGSEDDLLAGLGRPGAAETASVLSLALQARVGAFGASPPQELWGEAARRVALVGLLVAAATSLASAGWQLGHLTLSGEDGVSPLGSPLRDALLEVVALLWAPAYLAVVLGRPRTALWLALLALSADLTGAVQQLRDFPELAPTAVTWFAVRALPVLALAAFHRNAARPRPRPWLVALAVTGGPLLVPATLAPRVLPSPPGWTEILVFDWAGQGALAVTAAWVVHELSRRRGRAFGSPGWGLALAVLAVAASLERAATLAGYLLPPGRSPDLARLEITAAVEVLLTATAALVLATRSRADLRAARGTAAGVPGRGPLLPG